MDEGEEEATRYVPSTLEGVLLRLRLLKVHSEAEWHELHDDLLDSAIEGAEAMAAAASASARWRGPGQRCRAFRVRIVYNSLVQNRCRLVRSPISSECK
jgi:hypothetical protein